MIPKAKPLVIYVAREVSGDDPTEAPHYRVLGLVFANGRDRVKDATLVVSKRHRIPLQRVMLTGWDDAPGSLRQEAVAAETRSLIGLL